MARCWCIAWSVALVAVATFLLVAVWGESVAATRAAALFPCRVTIPNQSAPPGRRSSRASHGNGALWVTLPENGAVVAFAPGKGGLATKWTDGALIVESRPHSPIRVKFPWWGAQSVRGDLRISGHRLDRPAPALRVDGQPGSGQDGFWASSVIFPTIGCWKVTGAIGAARLAFAVRVMRG
jgi:hypothetical protein